MPDDPTSVPDSSYAYRLINPEWWAMTPGGNRRVTSQAFQDKKGYMSVALGVIMDEHGVTPADLIRDLDGYGVVGLPVSEARFLGLGVTVEVDDENPDPWHGGVHGKKTGSVRNKLVKLAEIIIFPAAAT